MNIEKLKREAKKLKKEKEITHSEALNLIAIREGYSTWALLMRGIKNE